MKRILFTVNGLGMGNSTRCSSVMSHLKSFGCKIDVLTNGNGIDYFERARWVDTVYRSRPLLYGQSTDGKLSVFKTLLSLPRLLKNYCYCVTLLSSIIKKNEYSAIIIDSDYAIFFLRRRISTLPVFALNNSDVVISECKHVGRLPRKVLLQYAIECLDYYFHKSVPDIVFSPAIEKDLPNTENIIHCPPLVRQELNVGRGQFSEVKRILVMLSGSQFGSNIEFLTRIQTDRMIYIDVIGRSSANFGNVTFHGKVFSNQELVNNCDLMVINGGFSAISEAVVLQKPMIVIPIENHTEQFVNGLVVERLGLGVTASELSAPSKIHFLISNFSIFKRRCVEFKRSSRGAFRVAESINQFLQQSQLDSSQFFSDVSLDDDTHTYLQSNCKS